MTGNKKYKVSMVLIIVAIIFLGPVIVAAASVSSSVSDISADLKPNKITDIPQLKKPDLGTYGKSQGVFSGSSAGSAASGSPFDCPSCGLFPPDSTDTTPSSQAVCCPFCEYDEPCCDCPWHHEDYNPMFCACPFCEYEEPCCICPGYAYAYNSTSQVPQTFFAEFSSNETYGNAPLIIQFYDKSFGSPTEWSWDFGDGGSSELQNPVHTFTQPGVYTVTLTVGKTYTGENNGLYESRTIGKDGYIIVTGSGGSIVPAPVQNQAFSNQVVNALQNNPDWVKAVTGQTTKQSALQNARTQNRIGL